MSKKIYLFSLVLLALTFTACSETEEAGRYDNWQARSEAFIDSIANVYNSAENKALPDNDPEKLHAYKDPTNNQMLYVKKISKDENSSQKKPLYTSTVSAYYRMTYFNGDVVQQYSMVAINTAIQVDLTGQVGSEGIGSRHYSGSGGQTDMSQGANHAKNGRSIIALHSTAKNGTISTIQPYLTPGKPVPILSQV